MGKTLLVVSVIIVTILFGMIFWKVTEAEQVQNPAPSAVPKARAVKHPATAVSPEVKTTTVSQKEEVNRSVEKPEQIVEQIAPPAFGFLPRGDSLQVVGLLSEHDRGGLLMEYIDQLCQSRSCAVDVDYQADIIDAKWQKDIVEILKLFQEGGIENGSFFIEANRIKLEGVAIDEKSAVALEHYFSNLKETGMGVENHIAIDAFIKKSAPTEVEQAAQKAEPTVAQKRVETKEETGDIAEQMQSVASDMRKTSKNDENVSGVTKEDETSLPLAHAAVQAENKKAVLVPDEANRSKPVQKKEVKKRLPKVVKKSVAKKVRVKKVRTTPKKPIRDIIAPSHMETSVDINRKISKNRMHTERSPKQRDDIVAESKLEILN